MIDLVGSVDIPHCSPMSPLQNLGSSVQVTGDSGGDVSIHLLSLVLLTLNTFVKSSLSQLFNFSEKIL